MRGRSPSLDPTELRRLIEEGRMTQSAAAAELGVSVSCVERSCKRLGLRTQRTGPRSGSEHTGWKGGVRIVKGYRYVYSPGHPMATKQGYVAEHRLVVALALGRLLTSREVVHHRDNNPLNNHPSNLLLFPTNADHLRFELTGRVPNWSPEGKERMIAGWRAWYSQRASERGDRAKP